MPHSLRSTWFGLRHRWKRALTAVTSSSRVTKYRLWVARRRRVSRPARWVQVTNVTLLMDGAAVNQDAANSEATREHIDLLFELSLEKLSIYYDPLPPDADGTVVEDREDRRHQGRLSAAFFAARIARQTL